MVGLKEQLLERANSAGTQAAADQLATDLALFVEHFEKQDVEIKHVLSQMARCNKKFDDQDERFDSVESTLKSLEDGVEASNDKINIAYMGVDRLERKSESEPSNTEVRDYLRGIVINTAAAVFASAIIAAVLMFSQVKELQTQVGYLEKQLNIIQSEVNQSGQSQNLMRSELNTTSNTVSRLDERVQGIQRQLDKFESKLEKRVWDKNL